jgi:hypothetical protein
MPNNKDHHFVPQFYLRNFGIGNSISLFNLLKNKHIPKAAISGQCQKSYLYTHDPQIEKNFSKAENEFARVINKIIQRGAPPKQWSEEHRSLMRFVIIQKERTPAAGRETQERMATIAEFVMKNHPPPPQVNPQTIKLSWINPILFTLQMMEKMAPTLMDLQMKILVNETNIEFIASDSPIAIVNQWTMGSPDDGGTALAHSGLQIFLPISPRYVILFYDGQIYNVGRQGSEQVKMVAVNDVNSINGLQLLTSESNLYGKVTQKDVSKLPLHWRQLKSHRFKTIRVVSEDGKDKDVYQFRPQPNVNLKLSFVRIVEKAKTVSPEMKKRMHRRLSTILQQKISKSTEFLLEKQLGPTYYRVVEEDG